MFSQPITLDTLHLPRGAVAVTMDNCMYSEGSHTSATDPTLSIHPLFSHPELLNEISLTSNDLSNGLQYHDNLHVTQGAEYTNNWMSSSISGQEFVTPGSSNSPLPSSIAFPSSVCPTWTPSDMISDPAEIYNKMTTSESESMDFDGSNMTQEGLSFWIVDSNMGAKQYQCECGKITKNRGDMRRHRQSLKHSGRSHSCPCGGSYTRKDSLKRHAQVCSYAAGNLNNA